jgi:hypothetical protein
MVKNIGVQSVLVPETSLIVFLLVSSSPLIFLAGGDHKFYRQIIEYLLSGALPEGH